MSINILVDVITRLRIFIHLWAVQIYEILKNLRSF